jgi:hypothetical protein
LHGQLIGQKKAGLGRLWMHARAGLVQDVAQAGVDFFSLQFVPVWIRALA